MPVGSGNVPRGGYGADRNNFGPRAGFAWTLDDLERWVVRGGYGVYYNQEALATSEGYVLSALLQSERLLPDPRSAAAHRAEPVSAELPCFHSPVGDGVSAGSPTPWLEHWNVSVQHQIGRGRGIEVAYVASRGHDLISARDMNQPAPSPQVPNLRPNPLYADITLIESRARSKYNALQVKFRQQMADSLSALVSYTFGKSTDDASGFFTSAGDPNFPQDSRHPEAEEGARASTSVTGWPPVSRMSCRSRPTSGSATGSSRRS